MGLTTAARLGFWAGVAVVAIDVVYVLTGVVWLISGGFHAPDPLAPSPAFLAVLEWLIIFCIPPVVVLMAAIHNSAPGDRKIYSLTALAFTIIFATLTSSVHFVQMAVVRHLAPKTLAETQVLHLYPWPSWPLAVDFLAWDFFLGLALLSGSRVFTENSQRAVRIAMTLAGALCLVGTLGPASGTMQLQGIAIVGYAGVLPVACALLAHQFSRDPRYAEQRMSSASSS